MHVESLSANLNYLQKPTTSNLSTGSNELQESKIGFIKTTEKDVNNIGTLLIDNNPPLLNTETNRSLLQDNATERAFPPHHSNAKIPLKQETPKQFSLHAQEADLNDNSYLQPDNKYDHVGLPNLNMTDSFSPMNLEEELDNDMFLKSLFS